MTSWAYYNEIDPFAAQWLRNLISAGLIPAGEVDTRSIEDVEPADLRQFRQCHFFAGIGGWAYAARLAGWPDDREIWTGSCPCQPFSTSGRKAGFDDPRHLWPQWFRLIRERRPSVVYGEQVAREAGRRWLDLVWTNMESEGYAFAPFDLPASGVGAPHPRQRVYFVADANCNGQQGQGTHWEPFSPAQDAFREADRLVHAISTRSLPFLCRSHDGVSNGVDLLHGFGNAIVPQLAAAFISAHMEAA